MALVGGAGNVTGGNPSGTGTGLNYIGNHAYAYSGAIQVAQQSVPGVTLLQFSTAYESYLDCTVMLGRRDFSGDDISFTIIINGENAYSAGFTGHTVPGLANPIYMILPPNSNITIAARNVSANTDRECYAIISGRVYA